MAYILVGSSDTMTLQLPSKGTTNWEQTLRLGTFQPLAIHDHVHSDGKGAGRGAPITDLAILLQNGGYLLGRNDDDTANISILRINTDNNIEINNSTSFICQEVRSTLAYTVAAGGGTATPAEATVSAGQCLIIHYSLKKASGTDSTHLLMGDIYLDSGGSVEVTERGHTNVKTAGASDFRDDFIITNSGTQLHLQNNHGSIAYTITIHITRLQ